MCSDNQRNSPEINRKGFPVIRNFKRSAATIGAVAASSVALVACSDSAGGLVAEGASSQQNAMDYFGAMYQEATGGDAYLEYNPTGSGSGRTNFVAGQRSEERRVGNECRSG